MDLNIHENPGEFGAASSVILVALLDTLVAKGIISGTDVVNLLGNSSRTVAPYLTTAQGKGAARIINELLFRYAKQNTSKS